jgi:hypothetical protein
VSGDVESNRAKLKLRTAAQPNSNRTSSWQAFVAEREAAVGALEMFRADLEARQSTPSVIKKTRTSIFYRHLKAIDFY